MDLYTEENQKKKKKEVYIIQRFFSSIPLIRYITFITWSDMSQYQRVSQLQLSRTGRLATFLEMGNVDNISVFFCKQSRKL